jgi:uncharacterized protein
MMYLKTRPAWAQLLMFIGLAFGSFMVLGMVSTMVFAKITGMDVRELSKPDNWDYSNPALLTFVRGSMLVQFLALYIIPCFLFAYFSDPKPAHYLGLKSTLPGFFLVGVALLIIALPLVDWMGLFNHQLIPENTSWGKWMKASEEQAARQIGFMLKRNTVKDLVMNLLFVAVFAGVGEELFFRGILQRIFIKMFKNAWLGIIVTAIIFSAIHFQFYGFIPRFILGVLLGLIYWYSGSLWPAILAHVAYDAFAVVMIYFNPALAEQENLTDKLGNQWVWGLLSAALVLALVYWMKKKSTNHYETVYAGDDADESTPFL